MFSLEPKRSKPPPHLFTSLKKEVEINDWRGWCRATLRQRRPDPYHPWEYMDCKLMKSVIEFDPPVSYPWTEAITKAYIPEPGLISVINLEIDERSRYDAVVELGRMLNL